MNEYVWVKKENSNFPIGAYILGRYGPRIKVKDDENNEVWITPGEILQTMHPTSVAGVEDMITLGELQDYSILRNLHIRYLKNHIYTYIGSVLITVNPYKELSIYDKSKMMEYRKKRIAELPPHIFAVAESSFESMRENQEKRCIVVSGESGAGKTESTKLLLKYLAGISSKVMKKEKQILDTNPILEAFGNAKTTSNNNASRFGKYISIYFKTDGTIYSSKIHQYLLEKSRIVSQGEDEQNYHIFYAMLYGMSEKEKKQLLIEKTATYNYLNKPKDFSYESLHNTCNIENIKSLMKALNFSEVETWQIFELIAAILHLGNIEFETFIESNAEAVKIKSEKVLQIICKLLGVSEANLIDFLTKRTISTHCDNINKLLSKPQAIDFRDGFVKKIYGNLFNFIVYKINEVLYKEGQTSNCYIGILDIFGFESFNHNSFEQLCINYASEKLQQFFVSHIFKSEQEQYEVENITWKLVDYPDNSEVLNLIETGNTSILSIINDESKIPKGSDQTLLTKLIKVHSENPNFVKPKSKDEESFGIKHFADTVVYEIKDFLEKNHDVCSFDVEKLVKSCENTFLQQIFQTDFDFDANANSKKRTESLASKFKISLNLLMNELYQCQPFFIRCIKPNEMKKPLHFDRNLCLKQLKYLGVTETTKIRQAGYAIRYDYIQFVERYRILYHERVFPHKINCKEVTKKICRMYLKKFSSSYQFGSSKIFLKHFAGLHLEKEREAALTNYVVCIQKLVRGWLERQRYKKLKKTVLLLENLWLEKQNRFRGVTILHGFYRLQAKIKSRKLTSEFSNHRRLITRLQAHCRGFLLRKLIKKKGHLKKVLPKDTAKEDPSSSFQKFAQKHFRRKQNYKFSKKPITSSLTYLFNSEDVEAAKALWITILRFTRNISDAKKEQKKMSPKALLRKIFEEINSSEVPSEKSEKKEESENLWKMWLNTPTCDLDKIHFIVGLGIGRPQLRDEIYCQICKAITKNSNEKAMMRGWDLMSCCSGCFAPSDMFLKFLKNFIQTGPKKQSSYCLFRLHRVVQNGSRRQPPCQTEYQAIIEHKPVHLKIYLPNNEVNSINIDSSTTAQEMLQMVAKNIKLTDYFGFSFVLGIETKQLPLEDGNNFILDAISECEQFVMEIDEKFDNVPWRIYLKKEMFAPWHDSTTDAVATNLICHQITEGIKFGEYKCGFYDLANLIAKFCYIKKGESKELSHQLIDTFLPRDVFKFYDCDLEQFKVNVTKSYRKIREGSAKSRESVQEDVIKYAMNNWRSHFSRYYHVAGVINLKSSSSYPEGPLTVGVNSNGVVFIDETNEKHEIAELTFMEIKEIMRKENAEGKGHVLKINSHTGLEICLMYQTSIDCSLHELLIKIIENLKKVSKFVIVTKDYKSLDKSFLELRRGDLVILEQKLRGKDLLRNSWAEGFNYRTKKSGNFLLENVEIIPTMNKPTESIINAMNERFPAKKINQTDQHVERLKHYTLKSYAADNFLRKEPKSKSEDSKNESNVPLCLWRYAKDKLRRPLHTKLMDNKKWSQAAVEAFDFILSYTEEKRTRDSEHCTQLAKKIFSTALDDSNVYLRDEVYCQIMKQLTLNPNRESESRLWELMWMVTGLFPCQNILVKEVKKFLQSRRTIQTARECYTRFDKILRSNPRKYTPHMIEIEAAKHRPCKIYYKIYFPDESYKHFHLDSLFTSDNLEEIILNRLKIKSPKGYGLYVCVAKRMLGIPKGYYIFDYFQLLKNWTEKNKSSVSTTTWQYPIYFMKQNWRDEIPGRDITVDLKFLFPQEYNKYIRGFHEISSETLVELAALLYKIYGTDVKSLSFQQILHRILPANTIHLKKTETWQTEILSIKITSNEEDCKVQFLKQLHKLPTYGLPHFGEKCSKTDVSNYTLYPVTNYSRQII